MLSENLALTFNYCTFNFSQIQHHKAEMKMLVIKELNVGISAPECLFWRGKADLWFITPALVFLYLFLTWFQYKKAG